MISFELPAEVASLEEELLRFARAELRPRMRDAEAAGGWDDDVRKTLEGFALAGLDLPADLGGVGAGALAKVVALEAVAFGDAGGLPGADRSGPAAAAIRAAPDGWGGPDYVLAIGGTALIEWLPGREAPEWTWVSDGTALRLLRTEGCPVRPAEAAAFEASAGVTLDLAGAEDAGDVRLTDEGALALRGRARLWYGAVCVGIARASLEYAIEYARERVVMGKPVAHHQGNAFAIADASSDVEAARLAVRAAAHRLDERMPWAGLWATLAYLDATETAVRTTDLGVQLLGGHGYIEDHPAEKWFREARMLALLGGGRDAALDDASTHALDAPDPVLG